MFNFKLILQQGWSEPNILTFLLMPMTWVYRAVMWLRKCLYRLKVFQVYRAPVPVVVVGNISVGGTGKTPITMQIVKHARAMGFKPAVISRGYGGQALEWPQIVTPESNPHYVGDEPVLIAKNVNCPVVVGPNRGHAIELLLEQFDCDLIISDDGLQHYALARDLEIAVYDDQRRHLNQFCLPSGPLRESPARLDTVDLVIHHIAPDIPDFEDNDKAQFRLQEQGVIAITTGKPYKKLNVDGLDEVYGVAGIGHPLRFFRQLSLMGYKVIEHAFPDHHRYQAADFEFATDYPVVMTEKDAIKCLTFARENWYFLNVEAELNQTAICKLKSRLEKLSKQ